MGTILVTVQALHRFVMLEKEILSTVQCSNASSILPNLPWYSVEKPPQQCVNEHH